MLLRKAKTLGYSPWGNGTETYPFDKLFKNKKNIRTEGFEGVDAVILWGGEDWHPSLYGQSPHKYSGARTMPEPPVRDVFEQKTMLFCKANNIPMIGVCRGSQGLCIGAGGSLIQHVQGHGADHKIKTFEGKTMMATSTHHQMMFPYEIKHRLLAWAETPRSEVYEIGGGKEQTVMHSKPEPEIVFFPQLQAVAIQGHPEYHAHGSPFVDFCLAMVEHFCIKGNTE